MSLDISVPIDGIDFSALEQLEKVDPKRLFRDGRAKLRPKIHHARMISRGCGGIESQDRRMYWASVLFTRMTVISSSIMALVPQDEDKDRWDAASICSLTRNLAECYLWMYFLGFDKVTDEEHEARILMMYALDNRGRERIMEDAVGDPNLAEYYKRVREQIAERLRLNPFFQALPEKRQNELVRGDKTPFVQDDLLERMGANKASFRAMYRLLSAQTHSSPVAFYDVLMIGGGSGTAHAQEMRYIGSALGFAVDLLEWSEADMLAMHPYAERRGSLISEKDVRKGRHIGFPIPK